MESLNKRGGGRENKREGRERGEEREREGEIIVKGHV